MLWKEEGEKSLTLLQEWMQGMSPNAAGGLSVGPAPGNPCMEYECWLSLY